MVAEKTRRKKKKWPFYHTLFSFIWADLKKTPLLCAIVAIGILLILAIPIVVLAIKQRSPDYCWCGNSEVAELSKKTESDLEEITELLSSASIKNLDVLKKLLAEKISTLKGKNALIMKTSSMTMRTKKYRTAINILESVILLPLTLISLLLGARLGPAWKAAERSYQAYFSVSQ